MCETDYSGYPDCRDDTIKAMQVALGLGMDRRFVIHTPLMWIDKAATLALAQEIGGEALVDLMVEDTHTCYLGDRSHRHAWGYGCGECPACELRAQGFRQMEGRADELRHYDMLRHVTTATITTMLLKKGIRHCWMNGRDAVLAAAGKRLVGPAFTLRFVPVREDLATPASWAQADLDPRRDRGDAGRLHRGRRRDGRHHRRHLRRHPVHAHGAARRQRARHRRRDARQGRRASRPSLPIWCQGTAAPASVNGLTFVGWNEPIACGGCRDVSRTT